MRLKLKLSHTGLLVFLITLVLEILFFVGPLYSMLQGAEAQIVEANRVRVLIAHLTKVSNLMEDLAMSMMKMLITPGDSSAPQAFHSSMIEEIPDQIQALKQYVQGDYELAQIERLQKTVNSSFPVFARAKETYEQNKPAHTRYLLELAALSKSATGQVNAILDYYLKMEEGAANEQAQSQAAMKTVLITGILLNVMWGFAIAIWFLNAISKRLNIVTDNALRFAIDKPLHPPLGGADEITSMDKVFREMVESLKEAQNKEKAIVENAVDVICSIDADSKFVEVNPACYTLWGYSQDELVGLRLLEIVEAGDKASATMDALAQGKDKATFENRIKKKDGTLVDILWSARWSNRLKAWFCVAHDITERKQAEQIKREFVQMISHDLRTPLTSVELSLDMMSRGAYGAITEKAVQRVQDARNNLIYVMNLINGLLDIEKMNAGKLEMRFSKIYFQDIIERAVEAVEPIAQRDGFELEVEADDVELVADGERLLQVIVNLVSNALKFSPKGGKVKIVAKESEQGVEVTVTDQGPGISAEQQERIFQRFERIDRPGQTKVEGSGLGLAISKEIVEQHGGSIGVRSVEGQGSTFFFSIPKQPSVPRLPAAKTRRATRS